MNPEKDKLPEETVDEQAAANSVFGAVEKYNADYNEILNQQDDYLVSRLEQQKTQAGQAYTQEKSAAYADYQKQVDPYGVQAEQMAQSGLTGSGYAESLKTQAYVAYQNRQAIAYKSYQDALVSFNNAFTEAKMQNDSQRAALAFQTFQMQFESLVSMIIDGNDSAIMQANNIMQNTKGDSSKWLEELEKANNTAEDEAITYESAKAALKELGVNVPVNGKIMWSIGKYGAVPDSSLSKYETYEDYLTALVDNARKGVYS